MKFKIKNVLEIKMRLMIQSLESNQYSVPSMNTIRIRINNLNILFLIRIMIGDFCKNNCLHSCYNSYLRTNRMNVNFNISLYILNTSIIILSFNTVRVGRKEKWERRNNKMEGEAMFKFWGWKCEFWILGVFCKEVQI